MSAFRSPSRWSKKMVPGPMVPEVHPKALLEPTPLPKQQASSKPMPVPRSPGRGARKNGFRTDGARSAPRGTSPTDLPSEETGVFQTDACFQVIRSGVRKNRFSNRWCPMCCPKHFPDRPAFRRGKPLQNRCRPPSRKAGGPEKTVFEPMVPEVRPKAVPQPTHS